MFQFNCVAVFLVLTLFSSTVLAQTVYDSCPMSAAYYQTEYANKKNVADLVCLQTAARRELEASSSNNTKPPSVENAHFPKTIRTFTRIETWCADQESRMPFDDCVRKQKAADLKIKRFLLKDRGSNHTNHEIRSSCSFYASGGFGTGSMGLEDLEPIASCIDIPAEEATSMFRGCVNMVTGKNETGGALPPIPRDKALKSYERIKMCFLSQLP